MRWRLLARTRDLRGAEPASAATVLARLRLLREPVELEESAETLLLLPDGEEPPERVPAKFEVRGQQRRHGMRRRQQKQAKYPEKVKNEREGKWIFATLRPTG